MSSSADGPWAGFRSVAVRQVGVLAQLDKHERAQPALGEPRREQSDRAGNHALCPEPAQAAAGVGGNAARRREAPARVEVRPDLDLLGGLHPTEPVVDERPDLRRVGGAAVVALDEVEQGNVEAVEHRAQACQILARSEAKMHAMGGVVGYCISVLIQ